MIEVSKGEIGPRMSSQVESPAHRYMRRFPQGGSSIAAPDWGAVVIGFQLIGVRFPRPMAMRPLLLPRLPGLAGRWQTNCTSLKIV
jgi:hypothetical protein